MDENRKQLTLGSLFDGIAGFPLAAERVGIKTVWTSEIEAACMDISARHFPEAVQLGDITAVDGAEVPPVDIVSFGSPCQDLSVAGKHEGIDGCRSGLFMEAVRIIREMREKTDGEYPKYIIWENVAGAFSSNKGEDFRRVLEEITETSIPMPASGRWAPAGMVGTGAAGGHFRTAAWRQMDAQFWGVPQRRKRIYLVADFGNGRAGQILFECESMLGYPAEGGEKEKGSSAGTEGCTSGADCRGVAEDADGQIRMDFGRAADRIYLNARKSVTLMGTEGGGGARTGLYLLPVYTVIGNTIGRTEKKGGNGKGIDSSGICPTLTSTDRHVVAYTQSGYAEFREGVGTIKKSRGAAGGGSETLAVIIERIAAAVKYRVRRLMPLECERLQGFPDGWTEHGRSGRVISDNKRYMALGNSIAVPCAERVFRGIIAAEEAEVEEVAERNNG